MNARSSFNLIAEIQGERAALAWLRAQYAATPSDALRAHALRAAKGSPELDQARTQNPFPRVSMRKPSLNTEASK